MSKDIGKQDNVTLLIQLYESYRLLWDTNEPNYRNNYKRKDSYDTIAKDLGVNNTVEVKKKTKPLSAIQKREKGSNTKVRNGNCRQEKGLVGFTTLSVFK